MLTRTAPSYSKQKTRENITCPGHELSIQAPLSPNAEEAVIEDTTMDSGVDMELEPEQVPDAEDMYAIGSAFEERRRTVHTYPFHAIHK